MSKEVGAKEGLTFFWTLCLALPILDFCNSETYKQPLKNIIKLVALQNDLIVSSKYN